MCLKGCLCWFGVFLWFGWLVLGSFMFGLEVLVGWFVCVWFVVFCFLFVCFTFVASSY